MRETGPYFKRIPPGAEPYVKIAETILGAYKRQLGLLGLTQGTITRTLQDGTVIRVARFGGNDVIEIRPARAGTEADQPRFVFIARPGADTSVEVEHIAGAAFGYYRHAPSGYIDEIKYLLNPSSAGMIVGEQTDLEYGATPHATGAQADSQLIRYKNTRISRWGRNSGYAGAELFYETTSLGPDFYLRGVKYTIPTTKIIGAGVYRRSIDNRELVIVAAASQVSDGEFIGYFSSITADMTGRAQWNGSNDLFAEGVQGLEAGHIVFYEFYPDNGSFAVIGQYAAPGGWITTGSLGASSPNYGSDIQDIGAQNPPSWNNTYEVYQLRFTQQVLEFSTAAMKASASMGSGSRIISSWALHPDGQPTMGSSSTSGYVAIIEFEFSEAVDYEPDDDSVLSVSFSYPFQDGASDDNSSIKASSGYLPDGTHVRLEGWEAGFPFGNTFSGFRLKTIGGSTIREESFSSPTARPWAIWSDFNEGIIVYASSTPDPYSGGVSILLKMMILRSSGWATVSLGSVSAGTAGDSGVGDVFASYPGSVAVSGEWVFMSLFGTAQCFDYGGAGGTEVVMVDWDIHKLYNKETGVLLDLGADKAWGVAAL